MAYDPLSAFAPLQTLTAAIMNKIKDNFAALWPYTTAGDISYASSATTLARLAKGTAGQVLKMNSGATAPEWGSGDVISGRQGGDATDWSVQGENNYTVSEPKLYVGVARIVITSGGGSANNITFPSAYTNKPIVITGAPKLVSGSLAGLGSITASVLSTSVVIFFASYSGTPTFTVDVPWMSIGE